ncbi:MAG: glycoside hydrolase family protein [Pirellulaceae bacterium]
MRTHRRLPRYVSHGLLPLIGTAAFWPLFAAAQVVRPDPTEVASVERANATLSATQVFENLDTEAGEWQVEKKVLVQADPSAPYARSFVKGLRWVDCIIKANVRVDSVGGPAASPGARLIVRGDEKTDTFYTVGLWAGSREVRIEKSRGLNFEPMTSNQFGTLAVASFPVELGKTYALTVVADHATIYCYIDGKFVVLAQESDFTVQPAGRVGFFTNAATATFSDVSVKGLKNVTSSPVMPYAGNPVNLTVYSPAVIKDDKFRMWDSLLGRYVESVDGILWIWPAGKESVVNQGNTGDWPTGNQCGDPDVLKFDGQYWITFWSTCNRRNGAFDGMGIKRSTDGIHWIPEPANPVFYMGPLGDWDEMVVGDHAMIRDGDRFKLWHVGITRAQRDYRNEFGYAESPDGIHWRKCHLNPILTQGEPGTWDGGWIYAAGIVKIDDEQSNTHVYAGKPGASYHLFYTGQPTNNEIICGVKRIGYAFSLDGIHWLKWNDSNTAEPFHDSDPVVTWTEYGQKGFTGVGAATAVLLGDEVRIYYSMYEERLDVGRPPEGPVGTAFATVTVDALRKTVADAKAKGLLPCASRGEVEATLDDPLPQSMWDDLQGRVLAAVQAKQSGNRDGERSALAEIAATRAKFTKALERHYADAFAPLKQVVDQLDAGRPVAEKVLWTLPAERMGNNPPQIEFTGLNVAAVDHPLMIEIEAKCNRFDVARVAWATSDGFKAAQQMEFIAGYPGVESPTHRVTIDTGGQPITAMRIEFPGGATVELKQIRIRELSI